VTDDRAAGSCFECFGWIVFLLISVVIFLFGLNAALPVGASTFGQGEAPTFKGITGTTWDATKKLRGGAQIDWMVRSQAILLMLVGALSGFISVTGFRRGELWAWLAMALWPIAIVAIDLNLFFFIKYSTSGVPPPRVSSSGRSCSWLMTIPADGSLPSEGVVPKGF
jgi:hypothetical protein